MEKISGLDTTNYWPITTGNSWDYYLVSQSKDGAPNTYAETPRSNMIIEVDDESSVKSAFYTKTNYMMYWQPRYEWDLKWYIQVKDNWMISNNSSDAAYADTSDKYLNADRGNPDSIFYKRASNPAFFDSTYYSISSLVWSVKSEQSASPPYNLWPISLDFFKKENTIYKPYITMHEQDYPIWQRDDAEGSWTKVSFQGTWTVKYSWEWIKTDIGYEGKALRVHFFEDAAAQPPWTIDETWYLVENYGLVRVDQTITDSEGVLHTIVNADRIILNK
jgi:hypothetical protein